MFRWFLQADGVGSTVFVLILSVYNEICPGTLDIDLYGTDLLSGIAPVSGFALFDDLLTCVIPALALVFYGQGAFFGSGLWLRLLCSSSLAVLCGGLFGSSLFSSRFCRLLCCGLFRCSRLLAVSAFCAARIGSRPDLSGYAAVYDMATGRRLAFADIVADRRRFTDALVAEARAQDPDLPESVRDTVANNPFMPKPGVQYLPISLTNREAIVFFSLMSNMLKEVSIPFSKHPGVFTARIQ